MEIIFSHGVKVRGITEDIEMQLRNKTVVIHSLHGFMKPHDFVSSEERGRGEEDVRLPPMFGKVLTTCLIMVMNASESKEMPTREILL